MAHPARRGTAQQSVLLRGGCNLACPVCDCRATPTPLGPDGWPRELGRGGRVLELRGEASLVPDLAEVVRRARASGWGTIRVRTNGVAFGDRERARQLAALGVDQVVLFLASDRPEIHDAIARVPGAQRAGLRGARMLAELGVPLALEIPVLGTRIQHLGRTIELGRQAGHSARALRLYSPARLRPVEGAVPRELWPPPWDELRAPLRAAVATAQEPAPVPLQLAQSERDGIPLCALASWDADGRSTVLEGVFAARPAAASPEPTVVLGATCRSCPAAPSCPGVTELYLERHGERGLRVLSHRPRLGDRAAPGLPWNEPRRYAARTPLYVVLRPTAHCNQDCWFCSANETSRNLEPDRGRMLRRIARVARTGAVRLSLSGGEPTLSRNLPDYVQLARALGIQKVELVTNAVLLDRPARVATLVGAGLTNLFVSLHAHNEPLSRLATRRAGDHARTVRALELFAGEPGVQLEVNHVVSAYNFRFLPRFVEWLHARFGSRVGLSLAFLSPQHRALEHLGTALPSYRQVTPFLGRALARAWELDIPVTVGSRQGVPPCVLGPFLPFSDVMSQVSGALCEDLPQKRKRVSCGRCRLAAICAGVWPSYVELHGSDELEPIAGPLVTLEQATVLGRVPFRRGLAVPSALRVGSGEIPPSAALALPAAGDGPGRVPTDEPRSPPPAGAPLRVALVGTGPRGRQIAGAMARLAELELTVVASPHAPDKQLPELGPAVVRVRSLEQALGRCSVGAVIVASHTADHLASARLALGHGLPCLVEKPLAASLGDAAALVAQHGGPIALAHQLQFSAGFEQLRRELGAHHSFPGRREIKVRARSLAGSSGSGDGGSSTQLYEAMIHFGDLVLELAGQPLRVQRVSARGAAPGGWVGVWAQGAAGPAVVATIELELAAPSESLLVQVARADGRCARWLRQAQREELQILDRGGWRLRSPEPGSDLERLLRAWARHCAARQPGVERGGRADTARVPEPWLACEPVRIVPAERGLAAMGFATEAVDRLAQVGIVRPRPR